MIYRLGFNCALALLLVWISCPGCVSSQQASGSLEKRAIPFQHVEIGLCEDYPREVRSLPPCGMILSC